jgi:hypothetical protein
VAIDDPNKKEDSHETKQAVITELTWAKLYTKTINKDLGAITTVIEKKPLNGDGPAMKKSARKVRDQLQTANDSVGELRDRAGVNTKPDKKELSDHAGARPAPDNKDESE